MKQVNKDFIRGRKLNNIESLALYPDFYIDEAVVDAVVEPFVKVDKGTLDSVNKFLHECNSYKNCDAKLDEECTQPHCQYAIWSIGEDSVFYCGRRE